MTERTQRQRITVCGVVQGVGFRPYVYGVATRLGLTGFVGNSSAGVFIEVEGSAEAVTAFQRELRERPPPLAYIDALAVVDIDPVGSRSFEIVESQDERAASTLISPDMCICDDCLRELVDPQDRRFRYPFINCTNCGPRFTITRDVPYDRPHTTMAAFPMCPACQAEYDNPLDRRFHAQPNACPVCGPQVWLQDTAGARLADGDAAIIHAQRLLASGQIVAVKGIGGFHLACDAISDEALCTLRQRKGRVDKPFAIMARDLDVVRRYADVSPEEAAILTSRQRPILLLRERADSTLSDLIAPGNPYIGIMLPYSPLHYLLIGDTPLVMTSGNFSGEPIVTDNTDALKRLTPLADAFLLHNRDIYVPCDDSVLRVFRGAELPIRRSRGYAPFPVRLPFDAPTVLAVGGELKNTFCLTSGRYAFMSQHIGDMENLETLDALSHAVAHMKAVFRATPTVLACDLHPRYLATRWAEHTAARDGVTLVHVQHHHAHIAAVMAEHGLDGSQPIIGVSLDGTGYGTDGTIWGGEVLIADYRGYCRAAYVRPVPMPGGDSAVKHPARLALMHLWAADVEWDSRLAPVAATSDAERRVIRRQLEGGINTVLTSSMGRLFDAVAALVGLRQSVTYEAQAAIELEAQANPNVSEAYEFAINPAPFVPDPTWPLPSIVLPEALIIDPGPVITQITRDVLDGVPLSVIAARFHNAVAEVVTQIAVRLREQTGIGMVGLSGGVYQNVRLLDLTLDRLRAADFEVITHRQVPPNDGGLALGQAMIAAIQ